MLRAQASVEKGDRPRPPYLSTVMQLGLSPHSLGAPSLLVRGTFGCLASASKCRNTPLEHGTSRAWHAAPWLSSLASWWQGRLAGLCRACADLCTLVPEFTFALRDTSCSAPLGHGVG